MINQKQIILWTTIFICLCPPNAIEAQKEDILVKIVRANEYYHEKDYQSAVEIFENLIAQGQNNGYLYYNLGNAHMRLGKTGNAILSYLRAKQLLPRNENLDANLRFAISQTEDQLNPQRVGFVYEFLFWIESISLSEHFLLLIIFNIIFWSVSIGLLYYRKPSWNLLKNITMGILLLTFFSTGIKYYLQTEHKTGVVLKSKVDIKSDRGIQDITLFQLHEGAIISVNQEEANWVHVSLNKNKSGWTLKKSIGY